MNLRNTLIALGERRLPALFFVERRVSADYVSYREADRMIRDGWRVYKELEDINLTPGWVYLERVVREPRFKKGQRVV